MKAIRLVFFLMTGSLLLAEQSPRISLLNRMIPIGEEVSVVVGGRGDRFSDSLELRLTTLAGKGEALFSNGENRLPLQQGPQRILFSGFQASSQINNITLSLYHEEEIIDIVLLTVMNPGLIRFDEAIAATEKHIQSEEDGRWNISYHLPSAYLQEDKNRFVVTYPYAFSMYREGVVTTKPRTSYTFLVDAKTGKILNVIRGGLRDERRLE